MSQQRINILIGIQARSTSERFPGKVFETIGEKTMIEHVIKAADDTAYYLNRNSDRSGWVTRIALLVPHGDPLVEFVKKHRIRVAVVEGSETDVLSRYVEAQRKFSADYVVRITGDCPLIPKFLITKCIKLAVVNGYDYLSNVGEESRTAADGFDCEVMTSEMLEYLDKEADTPELREHVTQLARQAPPPDAALGHVVGYLNQSNLKLSVDTPEDLDRVRNEFENSERAYRNAVRRFGQKNTHKF